jgi:hypothetical protein
MDTTVTYCTIARARVAQRMEKERVLWFNMKCYVARGATRRWALLFGVGYELYADLDFREIRARVCACSLGWSALRY